MQNETRRYITKVLYERAVYAQEHNSHWRYVQWDIYHDFKNHLKEYDKLKWKVEKLPLLTFGLGFISALIVARYL